ncbi:MAG TPA: hypothetical protein VFS14_03450 [Candidatus Saccharimonadales bacterium]|nr:hypothetical protein [Candidatus Saccharimonadales bacterium]
MRGAPIQRRGDVRRPAPAPAPTRPHRPAPAPVRSGHGHDTKKEKPFGHADPILPYAIGGGVIGLLTIFTLTVGSQTISIAEWLAFLAVVVWFVIGVSITLVYPVMIGVSTWRKRKFLPICGYVLVGLAYFTVSGIFMANFSLPIQ